MSSADTEPFNGAAVVVFGRDDAGRPHASAFDATTAELAERAAGLMGMRVLRLETDERRALAAKLPRGRVFESGRAFVPFVKRPIFESLVAFGGVEQVTSRAALKRPVRAHLRQQRVCRAARVAKVMAPAPPTRPKSASAPSCSPRPALSTAGGRPSSSRPTTRA